MARSPLLERTERTERTERIETDGWYLIGAPTLLALAPVAPGPLSSAATLSPASSDRSGVHPIQRAPAVLPVRSARGDVRHAVAIGRDELSDVVLFDQTVSRAHAFFREVGRRIELVDVGSRNGTFVNGERLLPGDSFRLYGGERLRFGSVELLFVDAFGCREIVRLAG